MTLMARSRVREDGNEVDRNGQVVPAEPSEDVPTIVARYTRLVDKAVRELAGKNNLQVKDVSAIAGLGRAVAMLQAGEQLRLTRAGAKALPAAQLTTEELQAALAADAASRAPGPDEGPAPVEAEFEEVEKDE